MATTKNKTAASGAPAKAKAAPKKATKADAGDAPVKKAAAPANDAAAPTKKKPSAAKAEQADTTASGPNVANAAGADPKKRRGAAAVTDSDAARVAKKPARRSKAAAPASTGEALEVAAAAAAAAPGNGSRPAALIGPAFPDTEYSVVEKLLVGFVSHEVRKVGMSKAVLGLSGGIDSAVSAAVAARALGPANVLGVMMPYQSSSPESLADANEVAAALGIETLVVDITPQVDAYFSRFPDASRLRRGNKMARERMTILYDHSAARSALVVGTSNKTELLLGYGTLYGDMASALNPIGDLYKTQVWGLASHLGLPHSVIDKAPTADLWTGQTDETELGFSYHQVDRLLYRMIDERCSVAELVDMGFDAGFVERISRMVRSSQFKRRLPIIAKLSARSIDTDFRYSRDWGL